MTSLTPRQPRLIIHPGEWYFGSEYNSLYTLLGSCVALSVWHPTLKLGGLCHYLLAQQPSHSRSTELLRGIGAGRYASSVLPLLTQAMQRYAALDEYQLGLFGGGDAFVHSVIGQQNIAYAQAWLTAQHLKLSHSDLGGINSRTLALNVNTGAIDLKHYAIQVGDLPSNRT